MRFVTPVDYTLVTTSVVNDYLDWSAGSYDENDPPVVYEDSVYRATTTTTDQPDVGAVADPPTWVRMGYSNQLRMFTETVDSVSSATGDITVDFTVSDSINTLGALGLVGSTIQLQVVDGTDGLVYDQTISLTDTGVSDWWEWHFLGYEVASTALFTGIPPYPDATYTLTISGAAPSDPIECGRVVFGTDFNIGGMMYGTSFSAITFSTITNDEFGGSQFTKRRTLARNDYDIVIEAGRVSTIRKAMRTIDAVPTLFIGTDEEEASILFGFSKEFDISTDSPRVGYMSLQVVEL